MSGASSLTDNSRVFIITQASAATTLSGLTITGGRTTGESQAGGGVYSLADVTLVDSTVAGNSTFGTGSVGGGTFGYRTLTFANSTVSNNSTAGSGASGGGAFGRVVTLTNTTVSGNSTAGASADGGGIYSRATTELTNSTLSGNSTAGASAEGGGIFSAGRYGGGIGLSNSIVLGNTTTGSGVDGDELFLAVGSNTPFTGGNIVGTNIFSGSTDVGDTTATQVFAATVNNNGVLAGALGDNGGSVQTIALLAGGDAVGRGGAALLPADTFDLDSDGDTAETLPIDANGGPRIDGTLDLGASEASAAPSLIVTTLTDIVDGSDGQTSLREAINAANFQTGADTITFAAGLSGTLRLTQGELVITDAVTIGGGGLITITGDANDDDVTDANDITDVAASSAAFLGDNSRVFSNYYSSAATTLSGLTITGGRAGAFQDGGGIRTLADLTLLNTTVSGNSTTGDNSEGGGIYGFSAVTLINSTISGNSTAGSGSEGGGIFSAEFGGSGITLTNSIVLGNTTTGSGVGGDELYQNTNYGATTTYTGGNIVGTNIFSGSSDVGDTTAAQVFAATVNNNGVLAGALGSNGGSVPTIALLAGGDAVGRGDATLLPADTFDLDNDSDTAEALPIDATGGPRVLFNTLDLGAVEAVEA
ncbi:MAG: CSLREA domain-containing protein, partial [Pseudomonadota bacterium]